jgi:hypothetical protein
VQKYLHDLDGWNALSTEVQEPIIGRRKLSNIELDDSIKPTSAHSALSTIVEDGKEIKILRDNMPFGRAADREFGTYFIGYSRSPSTTEQMLENMFIGRLPGNYDGCSTSAAPSPEAFSSCRPRHFWRPLPNNPGKAGGISLFEITQKKQTEDYHRLSTTVHAFSACCISG